MTCHGVPLYVITNGRIVVEEGEVHVTQGVGRFIPTPPFSPYVFMKINERDKVGIHESCLPVGIYTTYYHCRKYIPSPFSQVRVPKKVEREPYTGPTIEAGAAVLNNSSPAPQTYQQRAAAGENPIIPTDTPEFHVRPPTKGGTRNLQDSSFSLSGRVTMLSHSTH